MKNSSAAAYRALRRLHETTEGDWWVYCLYEATDHCCGCHEGVSWGHETKRDECDHKPDCPVPVLLEALT